MSENYLAVRGVSILTPQDGFMYVELPRASGSIYYTLRIERAYIFVSEPVNTDDAG